MALNPNYVIAPSLQSYFVDKDSGLPLSNGVVKFFVDGTNLPKPVYELNNVYPDYGYTSLGSQLVLSSVGTFVDQNGNDIIIYYKPYDDSGNIELYYIEVYDENGVLQFTRSAWPNIVSTISSNDVTNFVPNGQFLLHNNVLPSAANGYVAGQISADSTNIAPGGWYFVRSTGTTAVDNVSFQAYGATAIPSSNPPYGLILTRSVSHADALNDLCLRFPGVNTFASNSQYYTFYFEAKNLNSGTVAAQVKLYKYYGSSGSTATEVDVENITITTTYAGFNISILFGDNILKTISGGDDYVDIRIRFSPTGTQSVELTNFALIINEEILSSFPPQAENEQLYASTAGSMPAPDYNGSQLYLPVVMGPNGYLIDTSTVGMIYGKTQANPNTSFNELMLDGSTYVRNNVSPLGIPYSRLSDYLMGNSQNVTIGTSTLAGGTYPLWGTGPNFVTMLKNIDLTKFDLSMNTTAGGNSVNDHTSGFTHTAADPLYVFTVPAVPTAGSYFSFTVATSGPTTYNVWFSVDGSPSAPSGSPSGTNIHVELVTADTVATTITKIVNAINKWQFMLFDARGYFLRGLDPSALIDPDVNTRTVPGVKDNAVVAQGPYLGSVETSTYASHTHAATSAGGQFFESGGADSTFANGANGFSLVAATGASGGSETRPVNMAVNWFIRY